MRTLRQRMRDESPRRQEDPERVLCRHLAAHEFEPLALSDASLDAVWDKFDAARCAGERLSWCLLLAANEARLRRAVDAEDARLAATGVPLSDWKPGRKKRG